MSFDRWYLLIASCVYTTAAWFGVGYHGEDEFQHVILLAEHLRGHVDAASLPLDYHEQWRGMLLPTVAAGVFEVLAFAGSTDPFIATLVLRLLTGTLALWVMHDLLRTLRRQVSADSHHALVFISWSLWFLPVLLIRFNGEALGGLFFVRGLSTLLSERTPKWPSGIWFGLAVLCRPAVVLLPLGTLVWAMSQARLGRKRLGGILLGGAVTLGLGLVLDSIAYGSFAPTLWNYGTAALSGEEAHRFTSLPWYQYALFTVKYMTVPIGLLVLLAYGLLLVMRPKHPLVWVTLPFLIVHSILPVKEVRFLFPLAPLVPWLLIAAWDALCAKWPQLMQRPGWMRSLFPFVVLNLLALIVACSTPAGNGRIALARKIQGMRGEQVVRIDHMGDWRQWIPPFYLPTGSTEYFTDKVVPSGTDTMHLVIAAESKALDRVESLERIGPATPTWTHRWLRWYGLEDGYDPLVLYRLRIENLGH